MGNFFGNKVKESTDINDEIIANNMLASASAAANSYLNATVTSATPEIRAMYESSLGQILSGHAQLTELAVNKGWEKPYDTPGQQLSDTYNKSKMTVTVE